MTLQQTMLPALCASDPPSRLDRPEPSRRSFLGRTVAALAAGTAVNVGVIVARTSAPAATVIPTEAPDLLALGERIEPLLVTYRTAVQRRLVARATAEANVPALPDDLVRKPADWFKYAACTEREVDVEGKDVWPPTYVGADGKTYGRPPREIIKADLLQAAVDRGNVTASKRSKHGREVRRLIEIARRYETDRADAIEQSGVLDAAHDLYLAATDLDVLAWKIRAYPPVTVAGVMIHARALAAHGEAELDGSGFTGRAGLTLGRVLADAVVRVGAGLRGAA